MAEGKNQHYVPQRYFRMFSSDGSSIRTLRISDGKIIPTASIKGQSSKSWFYGDADIEKKLSQVESLAGNSLHEVANCSSVSELSIETMTYFRIWLALQRTRTAASRATCAESDTSMIRLMAEVGINRNEELSEEERKNLISALPQLHAKDDVLQLQRMMIATRHSGYLSDLELLIVRNKSNKPFVFSDAPCVYYNLLQHHVHERGVLGMQSLGLMIIFPLNEKTLAILYDGLSYKVRKPASGIRSINTASDVNSLNTLQLHSASNCIYYSNSADDEYLKFLLSSQKGKFVSKKNIVKESELRENSDGTASSILMTYEPQISYKLNLSFLSPKIINYPSWIITRDEYQDFTM
ncbi:MAG: DUF4238 domain-containing protein [Comamonas sp.]|uniref:DUF4238 domain-containing protein n=1 Tax=Comamonas sp. TaxID=34028 RepID=UPI0026494D79|nr:DUF4238 domain-containing protein [Comamonas sp.]MDN5503230.1 DUF4238 domain-containing protein [Comamonas sp.]MDN5536496.1 DUF4238 domain-containing protein [Comamonas sp.]